MVRGVLPLGAEPVDDEEVQALTAHFDVTPAGARLLTVLAREGASALTNKEKCGLADISEDTFYKLLKDPRFIVAKEAMKLQVTQGVFDDAAPDIARAVVKQAKNGDMGAAKMALEVAAVCKPTVVKHEHEHRLNDELLAMYRQSREQLPEKTFIDVEVVEKE